MPKAGDVVITRIRSADYEGSKIRPALVLFDEPGDIVIVGISTNLKMERIPIIMSGGTAQDNVIKPNYFFTNGNTIIKTVFYLNKAKNYVVIKELRKKLESLNP